MTSKVLENTIIKKLSHLPNPSETLISKRETIQLFHKTVRQHDIYAAVQNYRDNLSSMDISLDDSFYKEYLDTIDLRSFIRNVLAARDYGYAVLEITEYTTFKGKTVPAKIELCPPELFGFDSDRQLRFYHRSNRQGDIAQKKYPNKFILLQHEPTLTNPYGLGLLDVGYWLAVGLSGNYEFMMVFAEEDGRDKWVGSYPPDSTEAHKDKLMNSLVNLRNGGVAIKPEGMQIEAKDLDGRATTGNLYKDIDEMLRRKVSQLWFGTDLLMQIEGKGGYSSSQSGIEIKEDSINAGKHLIKKGVQQLFAAIQNINGMSPETLALEISQPKKLSKELAEIDQIYGSLGLNATKELLLKRGYDELDFSLGQPLLQQKQPNTDFAAIDDIDELADVFNIFPKKKD